MLSKFLLTREKSLDVYIDNLLNEQSAKLQNKKTKNPQSILIASVITLIGKDFIKNLCLSTTLLVYTYHNSDNDKNYASLPVSIKVAKKMFSFYINKLKDERFKETKSNITYRTWFNIWESENIKLSECVNDNFYSLMGCKIIDILTHSDVLDMVLKKTDNKEHPFHALEIRDKAPLSTEKRQKIFNMPTKLPMICPPKDYGVDKLGGYLLNDENFAEDLLVEKKAYAMTSKLDGDSIYNMINSASKIPFKINQPLLDYLNDQGIEQNLLINPDIPHKYADLEKRTKYQQSVYVSYNSKVILQESILDIAEFYRKFSRIYFPLKLDQRGRIYCSPSYLNYQSNVLSKALLIFAEPGIINKNNLDSIVYIKCYGANSFGTGGLSKQSVSSKLNWVDKNLNNIIDYKNGKLVSKAKDKLLFLSFCMEFKRYHEFLEDENQMEFYTYLPIQLDATCNGFQHMALLSNEDTLFKELNLVSSNDNKPRANIDTKPNDFYDFLLHKLLNFFSSKIDNNELIDNSKGKHRGKGSYERLHNFLWERAHVKKSIMTIPYNSSSKSMKRYIAESLVKVDCNDEETNWYSVSENNSKRINDSDFFLLIRCLKFIITNDFAKIKKLSKYLNNVAYIFNVLGLPITWTLPTGLTVRQSYLETKSTSITPFMYSKVKLNLKVTIKDKYDKNKQIRALMPNLIHSLDGSSLSLLYEKFLYTFSK